MHSRIAVAVVGIATAAREPIVTAAREPVVKVSVAMEAFVTAVVSNVD